MIKMETLKLELIKKRMKTSIDLQLWRERERDKKKLTQKDDQKGDRKSTLYCIITPKSWIFRDLLCKTKNKS